MVFYYNTLCTIYYEHFKMAYLDTEIRIPVHVLFIFIILHNIIGFVFVHLIVYMS